MKSETSDSNHAERSAGDWTTVRDRIDLIERNLQRVEQAVENREQLDTRLWELEDKFNEAMRTLNRFNEQLEIQSPIDQAIDEARADFERVVARFFKSKQRATQDPVH